MVIIMRVAALAALAVPALAQEREPAPAVADVHEVIAAIQAQHGLNLIVAPGVAGRTAVADSTAAPLDALSAAAASVRCTVTTDPAGLIIFAPTRADEPAGSAPRAAAKEATSKPGEGPVRKMAFDLARANGIDLIVGPGPDQAIPAAKRADSLDAVLSHLATASDRKLTSRSGIVLLTPARASRRARIHLSFAQHDVRMILQMIGALNGVDLVVDPNIKGPMSIWLKQVSVTDTLRGLAAACDGHLLWDEAGGGVIRPCAPSDDKRKISIKVPSATLADVALMFQASAPVRVAVDEKLEKTQLTCHLRSMPWRRALAAVAESCGADVMTDDKGNLRLIPEQRR